MDQNVNDKIYAELETDLTPDAKKEVTPDAEPQAAAPETPADTTTNPSEPASPDAANTPADAAPVDNAAPATPAAPVDNKPKSNEPVVSLADSISELSKTPADFSKPNLPQAPKPGDTVSPEDYQKHVIQAADSLVNLKIQAFANANRIKGELGEAMSEYPEINPRQDKFDNDLSSSVTAAANAFIKSNPLGNVKGFIDGLMKPYQKSIQREVGRKQETVARQVSQTAMRPTTQKAPEKAFKDLSMKEMEERLGFVY